MNKLIVVDVSVAIKWRLNDEECITEARQLLRDYQEGKIDFLAPKLFLVEVANAFAAAAMRKRLSAADAFDDFHAIADVAFPLVEDADYIDNAWQIAMKHSRAIYDALYLALAESLNCDFYTGDKKLYNAVKDKLPYVKWIGEYKSEKHFQKSA
jgi:predicted nucleic acid-binding protein